MNNAPIFILGAHKSGTSLLRSLLDDHRELNVIPFETHFLELLDFWIENPTRTKIPSNLNDWNYLKKALELAKHINWKDSPYGDVVLARKMDINSFSKNFRKYDPITPHDVIQVYFESILLSLNKKMGKRVVEKSVENFEYAAYLKKLFPNAKFIHIVRNPYSNIVALRKFKEKSMRTYPRIDRIAETIRQSFYYAEKNKKIIEDYKVIRYEDLIENPEKVMANISGFIMIEFTKSLLKPTSQGIDWLGNSTSGVRFQGVTKERINAWKAEIKPLEIEAVNRKMTHILSFHGYTKVKRTLSYWRRCKREALSKYLNNRLYLYQ